MWTTMSLILRKLIDPKKIPKSRIELHIHLETAVRYSTLWQLSKKKGMKITPNGTLEELKDYIVWKKPETMGKFTNVLNNYAQVFIGDSEALERIAYEVSEDEAKQHVLYFEARIVAHNYSNTVKVNDTSPVLPINHPNAVSPKMVVQSVLRGLKRAQTDFGIHSSLILSCIRSRTDWNEEVLRLANEFRHEGVVGIDISGDEHLAVDPIHGFSQSEVKTFRRAKELGIHRTCHAGEDEAPAVNVGFAMDQLCCERIGHGYHVIYDKQIYRRCLKSNIHFETCPYSSYFTGAIKPSDRNSIVQFAEDRANFSLSKDDPTFYGSILDDEYQYMYALGLNESHVIRANINAAKSSFLPKKDKKQLLRDLYNAYGINQ